MANKKEYTKVTPVKIKDVPAGTYFTYRDYGEYPDERRVYVRDTYDRSIKKYLVYKFDDVNHYAALKGDCVVFVGFTF